MASKNKDQQGVQNSNIPNYGGLTENTNKNEKINQGNTENGQMPEDVIERKMFDFDAVRKETEGGTNDTFESSNDVEVRSKDGEPSDKATQHSNHNTLDRRSNIQTQQGMDNSRKQEDKKN